MSKRDLACNMIHLMGVTQKDMASKIGMSTANFSRMMKGKVSIDKHFEKINGVFEIWKDNRLKDLQKEKNLLLDISRKATKCLTL